MSRNLGWRSFGRTDEGRDIEYAELIRRLKQPVIQTPASQPIQPTPAQAGAVQPVISPSNSGDFWRININYRNAVYRADLSKSLLDGGIARTQQEWAKYTNDAKPKGDFYVGDMPLYFSILSAFSKATGKDADEAREFLKKQMRAKWLMTLTRVQYNPKGSDKIIHNFYTPDIYEVQNNFIGGDSWIKDVDTTNLEALLGNGDKSQINAVFQKINDTDAYLWRVNSKPKKVDERVAWFGAGSDRADLDCDRGPSGSDSLLGVRMVRA
jgi:hypothetical protein